MSYPSDKQTPVLHKLLVITSVISVMAGTITGIMTYVNLGYGPDFFANWFSSLVLAVCILVPAGYVVMTSINWVVARLFTALSDFNKNLIVGVLMAVAMESIMALSTAANTIGFGDIAAYISACISGFVTALPVGVAMSLIMTLTVKPRLEKFMAS